MGWLFWLSPANIANMSRGGSKPGERRGGRLKGSLNIKTRERLEREKIAEQVATEIGASATGIAFHKAIEGRRLAKDEIKEAIPIIKGIVAHYQQQVSALNPETGSLVIQPEADLGDLKDWMRLFVDTCFKLATYESPTFKAIVLAEVPQPGDDAKMIDLQSKREPEKATETYLRLIRSSQAA
jgi:hypothetical protein